METRTCSDTGFPLLWAMGTQLFHFIIAGPVWIHKFPHSPLGFFFAIACAFAPAVCACTESAELRRPGLWSPSLCWVLNTSAHTSSCTSGQSHSEVPGPALWTAHVFGVCSLLRVECSKAEQTPLFKQRSGRAEPRAGAGCSTGTCWVGRWVAEGIISPNGMRGGTLVEVPQAREHKERKINRQTLQGGTMPM